MQTEYDNLSVQFICTIVLYQYLLTIKAPIMTAAEIYFSCFSEKIRLDVSSEFSAKQRIHMENQAFFSKDKSKKLKCCLLHFLFGALRAN